MGRNLILTLCLFKKQIRPGPDGQQSSIPPQRYLSVHKSESTLGRSLGGTTNTDLVISRRLGDAGVLSLSSWLDERLRSTRSRSSRREEQARPNSTPLKGPVLPRRLGDAAGVHFHGGSWFADPLPHSRSRSHARLTTQTPPCSDSPPLKVDSSQYPGRQSWEEGVERGEQL